MEKKLLLVFSLCVFIENNFGAAAFEGDDAEKLCFDDQQVLQKDADREWFNEEKAIDARRSKCEAFLARQLKIDKDSCILMVNCVENNTKKMSAYFRYLKDQGKPFTTPPNEGQNASLCFRFGSTDLLPKEIIGELSREAKTRLHWITYNMMSALKLVAFRMIDPEQAQILLWSQENDFKQALSSFPHDIKRIIINKAKQPVYYAFDPVKTHEGNIIVNDWLNKENTTDMANGLHIGDVSFKAHFLHKSFCKNYIKRLYGPYQAPEGHHYGQALMPYEQEEPLFYPLFPSYHQNVQQEPMFQQSDFMGQEGYDMSQMAASLPYEQESPMVYPLFPPYQNVQQEPMFQQSDFMVQGGYDVSQMSVPYYAQPMVPQGMQLIQVPALNEGERLVFLPSHQ